MIPLLAAAAMPLIQELMKNGLTTLAGAVANKGKEFVEEKLGVKLDEQITPEKALALKQLEMDHEESLQAMALENRKLDIEAEKIAQGAVSDRWNADMHSDSWLSKNIRPLVLIYLLGAYSVFSIGSGFGFEIKNNYVELLAQWGMLVMSAYFVGRTVEKAINVKEAKK